jgi:hypothetical protein
MAGLSRPRKRRNAGHWVLRSKECCQIEALRRYGIDEESFRLYALSNNDAFSEVQESLVRSPTRRRSRSTQSINVKKNDNKNKNKGPNAAIITTTTGTITAGARTSTMEEKIHAQEKKRQ